MALPTVRWYVQVLVETINGGIFTTMHYYEGAQFNGSSQDDFEACCDSWMNWLKNPYAGVLHSSSKILGVRVKHIIGNLEWDGESQIAALPGTASTAAASITENLPDDVVLVFQKRTGLVGRQNRGRWFISGISSAWVDDGKVRSSNATINTQILTLCGRLATDAAEIAFTGGEMPHARHYDRKGQNWVPIQQVRALDVLMSRMDRRTPMVPKPVRTL